MVSSLISFPQSGKKKRFNFRKDSALSFIEDIESSWKGHEPFAFWLVERLKPKIVVDLGFDRGLSTLAFAYRNRGHVYGIDWFDEGDYASKCFALDTAFRNISRALRFQYAKNIHLIVGSYQDVLKTWNRTIDILHIDFAHTYVQVKKHYTDWARHLSPTGVILIHDVLAYPEETGRFFQELPFPKTILPHSKGLGVACREKELIEKIGLELQRSA